MKVYVVYLLGYTGNNKLEILGVYQDIKKAEKRYYQEIVDNIADFDFDYDKECEDIKTDKGRMSRLFKGGYQENWDNYLEICIEEQEVI